MLLHGQSRSPARRRRRAPRTPNSRAPRRSRSRLDEPDVTRPGAGAGHSAEGAADDPVHPPKPVPRGPGARPARVAVVHTPRRDGSHRGSLGHHGPTRALDLVEPRRAARLHQRRSFGRSGWNAHADRGPSERSSCPSSRRDRQGRDDGDAGCRPGPSTTHVDPSRVPPPGPRAGLDQCWDVGPSLCDDPTWRPLRLDAGCFDARGGLVPWRRTPPAVTTRRSELPKTGSPGGLKARGEPNFPF